MAAMPRMLCPRHSSRWLRVRAARRIAASALIVEPGEPPGLAQCHRGLGRGIQALQCLLAAVLHQQGRGLLDAGVATGLLVRTAGNHRLQHPAGGRDVAHLPLQHGQKQPRLDPLAGGLRQSPGTLAQVPRTLVSVAVQPLPGRCQTKTKPENDEMCNVAPAIATHTHPSENDPAEAFAERMIGTLNAGATALMLSLGHRTGLFDCTADLPAAHRSP